MKDRWTESHLSFILCYFSQECVLPPSLPSFQVSSDLVTINRSVKKVRAYFGSCMPISSKIDSVIIIASYLDFSHLSTGYSGTCDEHRDQKVRNIVWQYTACTGYYSLSERINRPKSEFFITYLLSNTINTNTNTNIV